LSIKAKDMADEADVMQKMATDTSGAASGTTNLGALLKAKMDTKQTGL
jgi:small subunit ribosomal protein S1